MRTCLGMSESPKQFQHKHTPLLRCVEPFFSTHTSNYIIWCRGSKRITMTIMAMVLTFLRLTLPTLFLVSGPTQSHLLTCHQ